MDAKRYADTQFGAARSTGGQHGYVAYFPRPLPRSVEISGPNVSLMADAEAALGRLAGTGRLLPNPELLVRPYLRKEALASTRIEGTQASLSEVFEAEVGDGVPGPDVEEVINYVAAVESGLSRLETLPLSGRLLREMHAIILAGVRGRDRQPGEFRRSQNWVGNPGATIATARFVPPPADEIEALVTDLERLIHESSVLPPVVEAALLHYQFETIHPFLDGNGRLGRLLIVFFLVVRGRLPAPLLYISPYFEERRDEYYEALQGVRERGDLQTWLDLFFRAVCTQATDALWRAELLIDLRERYRDAVRGRTRGAANDLVDELFVHPVITARTVESRLGITRPSALAALRSLEDVGILSATHAGSRGQLRWQAKGILGVLAKDPSPT
jgi:Fic family protein